METINTKKDELRRITVSGNVSRWFVRENGRHSALVCNQLCDLGA